MHTLDLIMRIDKELTGDGTITHPHSVLNTFVRHFPYEYNSPRELFEGQEPNHGIGFQRMKAEDDFLRCQSKTSVLVARGGKSGKNTVPISRAVSRVTKVGT